MSLCDDLLFDKRYKLHAGTKVEIEEEVSLKLEWSGIFLIHVPREVLSRNLGCVLSTDTVNIYLYTHGLIKFWLSGVVVVDFHTRTFLNTGEYFVLAFTVNAVTATVTAYLNGRQFEATNRSELGSDEPFEAHPTTLASMDFLGAVARFSLYHRVLSPEEMVLISNEYLHPRVVQVRGKQSHNSVDSVCFVFSDGRIQSYGEIGGLEIGSTLELEQDEYVTHVEGCGHESCFDLELLLKTNKNQIFQMRSDIIKPPHAARRRWEYTTESAATEIFGLTVEHDWAEQDGDFICDSRVVGVLQQPIVTPSAKEQWKCRREVESGYLNQLKNIKVEALNGAAKLSLTPPDVSDWHVEAKQTWQEFLHVVESGLSKPKLFLDAYQVDPVPCYVSPTTAVMRASWKDQRVALKFMVHHDQVQSELEGRAGTSPEFIVPIIAVYADENEFARLVKSYGTMPPLLFETKPVQVQSISELATKINDEATDDRFGTDRRDYRYCLVMVLGDTTLKKELKAGAFDARRMGRIAADIARALQHLHKTSGRIHADLTPANIVEIKSRWLLLDLDASCRFGEPFGEKRPSCGYCPPEMARALLELEDDGHKNFKDVYAHASVAHDLWSLGCVIFQMVSRGDSLFTTKDGNLEMNEMRILARWSVEMRDQMLNAERLPNMTVEAEAATRNLLEKLLEPEIDVRLGHWDAAVMLDVMNHDFFHANRIDEFQEQNILLNEFRDKSGNCRLRTGIAAVSRSFFVDPVSYAIARTNDGKGFVLTFPREWVVKSLPYLTLVLKAIQLVPLSGCPMSDWATNVEAVLASQVSALQELETNCETDLREVLDKAAKTIRIGSHNWLESGCNHEALKECLLEASKEMNDFLTTVDNKWMDKTGLVKTKCDEDGTIEWVLEKYVGLYKRKGPKCLGSRIQPPDEVGRGLPSSNDVDKAQARIAHPDLGGLSPHGQSGLAATPPVAHVAQATAVEVHTMSAAQAIVAEAQAGMSGNRTDYGAEGEYGCGACSLM